ncbi:hypothetical protein Fmac_002359 [Flemingia macrophylla]|uniref:Uncharacterized protein n=1 Tax=Flemingia macrophylla TaxID=520843 RepID=A0ABD1NJN9_9FABA
MSFYSSTSPNTCLHLTNMSHVPSITKNLVNVSKFSRDNHLYFEFHPTFCLVKSHVDNSILLEGFLMIDSLYYFPALSLQKLPQFSAVNNFSSTTLTTIFLFFFKFCIYTYYFHAPFVA